MILSVENVTVFRKESWFLIKVNQWSATSYKDVTCVSNKKTTRISKIFIKEPVKYVRVKLINEKLRSWNNKWKKCERKRKKKKKKKKSWKKLNRKLKDWSNRWKKQRSNREKKIRIKFKHLRKKYKILKFQNLIKSQKEKNGLHKKWEIH